MKYAFIKEASEDHSVTTLCRVLRVSRSGYYHWLHNRQSRQLKDQPLLDQIQLVHEQHRGNSGVLKTWEVLQLNGISCGKHRVARIRREHGIVAKRRRRFIAITRSRSGDRHAPNLLGRAFAQSEPNRVWVGDVTYIPARRGLVYLAVLIDLYSRLVVGWSLSNRNDVVLIVQALKMANRWRRPKPGLMHHTDRGVPYASRTYKNQLKSMDTVASMSAKGDCWDNAVAESFFATLEFELLDQTPMADLTSVRREVGEFIELFYNRQRAHQTLGYKTPVEMESVA